ncbi:galactose-1-phosphate uridylyltransferase [Roseofilum casamattae]|uniref:Galactose-1-phosphate uridylyltransferase n=1 Tax=Roseofilum casamattae BLCC-M143 TaxID=3022442 RepID=A0ABT7C168_9CYAN|nr:galactose-1-phosphate uridylyltransferase [Roseofilum casamattae]MDJ1184489.1 galactose-1-phosphate uridylyltransferase [Roseofilum casamattae BLCC-M143]
MQHLEGSHIRLNKVTREWVIYAPNRKRRPQDTHRSSPPKLDRSQCPFCPGGTHEDEKIILELPRANGCGWQTRVIANRYPALSPMENTARSSHGIYLTMPGYGRHEVIIESPDHDKDIPTMERSEVELIVETYHHRYIDLMQQHESMMAIIFRNHGQRAGASQPHPHSQIIVTSIVPQQRRWKEEEAQRYYDDWGRCLYCDVLEFEMKEQTRVIAENDTFLAFVPFAAKVPFEINIAPKHHEADFGSITDREKVDFAAMLHEILTRLADKLNDPDYNYTINTAARYKAEEPQVHWYCQIRPRLTTPAGFEIASSVNINPSLPEWDAQFLRE